MASEIGIPISDLIERLERVNLSGDYFKVVAQLKKLSASVAPELSLYFPPQVDVGLAPTDIESVGANEALGRVEVGSSAFGLFSQSSYLPAALIDYVHELPRKDRQPLLEYLGIFNTRLSQLFFESRSKFTPALDNNSLDSQWVSFNQSGFHELATPNSSIRARMVGTSANRSSSSVAWLLSKALEKEVEIRSFEGCYQALGSRFQAKIGEVLFDKALGRRLWMNDTVLLVHVKEVHLSELCDYSPDGSKFENICELVNELYGSLNEVQVSTEIILDDEFEEGFGLGHALYYLGRSTVLTHSLIDTTQ